MRNQIALKEMFEDPLEVYQEKEKKRLEQAVA